MASISEFKKFTASEICRHICLTILRKTIINIRHTGHPIIWRKFVHNILMFIKNVCKKCKHHIWLIKLILLAIKRKSDITCTCSLSCSGVISYTGIICYTSIISYIGVISYTGIICYIGVIYCCYRIICSNTIIVVLFFKFLQYININFVILVISKIVIH